MGSPPRSIYSWSTTGRHRPPSYGAFYVPDRGRGYGRWLRGTARRLRPRRRPAACGYGPRRARGRGGAGARLPASRALVHRCQGPARGSGNLAEPRDLAPTGRPPAMHPHRLSPPPPTGRLTSPRWTRSARNRPGSQPAPAPPRPQRQHHADPPSDRCRTTSASSSWRLVKRGDRHQVKRVRVACAPSSKASAASRPTAERHVMRWALTGPPRAPSRRLILSIPNKHYARFGGIVPSTNASTASRQRDAGRNRARRVSCVRRATCQAQYRAVRLHPASSRMGGNSYGMKRWWSSDDAAAGLAAAGCSPGA